MAKSLNNYNLEKSIRLFEIIALFVVYILCTVTIIFNNYHDFDISNLIVF